MSARLRILKRVYIARKLAEVGEVVEVDDNAAFDLLNSKRAEPADEATAARFKTREILTWSAAPQDSPFPSAEILAMAWPKRA
jgi:hypothetical protein